MLESRGTPTFIIEPFFVENCKKELQQVFKLIFTRIGKDKTIVEGKHL